MPYVIVVWHLFALSSLMHCTIFLLAHTCAVALDNTEPKLEVSMKQGQAEDLANLALDQGKLQCISPMLLIFYFKSLLYVIVDRALGYISCLRP
jgi:hypothetical protein